MCDDDWDDEIDEPSPTLVGHLRRLHDSLWDDQLAWEGPSASEVYHGMAKAVREHGAMMPKLDSGILYGIYVDQLASWQVDHELGPVDWQVDPALEPVIIRAITAKGELSKAVKGNSCIPETMEADHASRVCRYARDLPDFEAGLIYGLTGICPEDGDRLCQEAADATAPAYRELYGDISDHI